MPVRTGKKSMKQVDTKEYISILRELTEEGRQVSLIVAGNSMAPFLIHGRDTVWFEKPKRPLKRGDIVFFQRDDGSFILHRLRRVHKNALPKGEKGGNGYPPDIRNTYDIIGDAQLTTECGIRRDQIFAIVIRVERKGKIIGPGDFWWLFFERVWIRIIPIRPLLRALYGIVSGH